MTHHLRDALDDLARPLAATMVGDDLAARVRAAGRRRRRRRRLGTAAALVLLLGAIAIEAIPLLGSAIAVEPADAQHHHLVRPQRISKPWWSMSDLPARPGPVSVLLTGTDHWYAVTGAGKVYRIPAARSPSPSLSPSLSPDGRRLAYRLGDGDDFVIRDLVSGERRVIPATDFARPDQQFWSPDGTRLALHAYRPTGAEVLAVVGPDGRVTTYDSRPGAAPAGWADNDSLVWLTVTPSGAAVADVVTLSGQVIRTVTLRASPPWHDGPSNALASPDGAMLLTAEDGSADHWLRTFSLTDGGQLTRVNIRGAGCGDVWAGSSVAVPLHSYPTPVTGTGLVVGDEIKPIAVVDPGLEATCLRWASDALTGPTRWTLFGTSNAGWTWWPWPDIAIFPLVVVAVWLVKEILERRSWAKITRDNATWRGGANQGF